MQLSDLLEMDMGEVIDCLIEHAHEYDLVLIGLPYTGFGIHNYNENLKKELEILHGNGYNSEIE